MLQDFVPTVWTFFEAYGWLTVLIIIFTYFMYKKYIYNVIRAQSDKRKVTEQNESDRQMRELVKDRMQLARERQQKEHNEKERSERMKLEQKQREETEKRRKRSQEGEKVRIFDYLDDSTFNFFCLVIEFLCGWNIIGHYSSTSSTATTLVSTKKPQEYATEIIDNLLGSTSITIIGYSTCPKFRKACQLVATYRLDISMFRVFEFDKQPDWPVEEILVVLENRFQTRESPFVFIRGEYIGGLEEIRKHDKSRGLDKF
uniref:Glutaredoxin domain-containing protein n=1 Tax=Caenorhabditis tropicalis TaxID=1561998 RepID=A0A1I7U333_9PELO